MLATNNIALERILLHARATSMFTPGIERTNPCCETGTPIKENMSRAATALSACKNSTTLFKTNDGMGTIQKRKTRGKRSVRAARAPKHATRLAIHHSTRASEDVRASGCHPTTSDTTQRKAKLRFDRIRFITIRPFNRMQDPLFSLACLEPADDN